MLIRKTNIYKRFFFVLILTLFVSKLLIFSETAEIKTDYAFAEKLFLDGDYRASLVELKRILYYAPADQVVEQDPVPAIDLRKPERLLMKCYAVLDEKSDLKKELKKYIKKHKEEKADLYFDLSKTLYQAEKYKESEEYNNLALESAKPDEPYFKDGTLVIFSGILKLKLLDFPGAKTAFDNFLKVSSEPISNNVASERSSDNQESYNKEYQELATALSQELNTLVCPCKSVPLSVLLSALLPGSGQVYAGNYKKGLYSFLINASLIGASAYSFTRAQDEKLSGALFLVIDFPFYYKNIREAVSYANKYNEKSKEGILKQIEKKYNWDEYVFK